MASSSHSMKELEDILNEIQLEDKEEGIMFDDSEGLRDEVDARWCLVGRLLSERPADFEAVRNVMATLWRPGKGMFVKELDVNMYLFQFFHEVDIHRALEGSPWTFNKIPLVIERLKQGENPRTLTLNTMEIWVQVYDLKVGFMSEKVLKAVGGFIGQFVLSCPKNFTGIWRDYLRVRVLINIDRPLKRRMKIFTSKDKWFWVNFKYERLPTFCFICGVIGHSDRFCHKLFDESAENIAKPYGMFMKAPDRRNNKHIGARWLRDNMAQPMGGNTGGGMAEEDVLESRKMEVVTTMVKETNQEGVISGIRWKVGDHGVERERREVSEVSVIISDGNNNSNKEEGVTFTDSKRRRTQNENDLGQVSILLDQNNSIKGVDQAGINGEMDWLQKTIK